MNDTPLTARDDDYTASLIAQARHAAGGHLMIGHNGFTLYFGKGQSLSGYDSDAMKAEAIAARIPLIDARAVPYDQLAELVITGPMIAVGEEPSHVICEALSTRPLAEVAQRYRAIGADVRHVADG